MKHKFLTFWNKLFIEVSTGFVCSTVTVFLFPCETCWLKLSYIFYSTGNDEMILSYEGVVQQEGIKTYFLIKLFDPTLLSAPDSFSHSLEYFVNLLVFRWMFYLSVYISVLLICVTCNHLFKLIIVMCQWKLNFCIFIMQTINL